jgi:gluconolactonase
MFAAPSNITAEVYATLPSDLRVGEHQALWGGVPRDSFLEAPVFLPDGDLVCVNVPYGQLLRTRQDRTFIVEASYDGQPNGLAVAPDGSMLICDYRRGLMRCDGANISVVAHGYGAEHFRGPNDLVIAANGDVYFTDQGESALNDPTGRLFRWREGRIELVLSGIPSPNGLALIDDDRTILLAVTRANAIWRVPLRAEGVAGRVGTFIQLSGGMGPDGMAVDRQGRVAVAHLGLGTVWVFDPFGELLFRIRSPLGRAVTNVAFHSNDDDELYITEADSGSILRARLPRI